MSSVFPLRRHGGGMLAIAVALVALAALGSPAAARAQSQTTGRVTGTVVDEETGQPIAAALARVLEVHRSESTHEDGTFTFAGLAPGSYTLVLQRIGYRLLRTTVAIRAGADTALRVAMAPAAVQLSRQVVTGTLSERAGDEVLSATSVVSGAELERRVQGTIAQTLENEPGVAVTSVGPATSRPVIRGLSGDRILVLEDGQRPGDMSSTSGDHAVAIDPVTATQIEVVRGPMSLLYGSSALGGVVNVVRDEVPASLPEHPHGAFTLEGSSVNSGVSGGGFVASHLGNLALRAEASGRTAGDVRTPVGRLVNTAGETINAAAGLAYVGRRGHVGGSYRFYDNSYGIPGGFVGAHPEGVDIEMRRHTVRGEVETHHRAEDGSPFRLSGGYSDYHHVELEKSGTVGTVFDQNLAELNLIARHGAHGPFTLGAVGGRAQYRDIVTGGSLRTPSTRDVTVAGFLVEEARRGPVSLQGGLRYDWARYAPQEEATIFVGGRNIPVRPRTFGSVSGSLGLLWTATPGVRIGASLARAYRTPDFNELYSDGPHLAANSYDVGDPELGEETGLGTDVFVRVDRGRVRAEVAAFRNQLSNYIFPSSRGRAELGRQGERPRFQYTNEDALFTGSDGELEVSLTRYVVLEGTLSYVRARFTSARDSIPVIAPGGTDTSFVAASEYPPLIPPLHGRVALRHEHPRWFVEGGVRAAARQERTGDFETPTAGYGLADFSAGVRLLAGSRLHSFTLRADNLFDKEYREHLSRTKVIMPQPGRNVSLLYRLTF